MQNIRKKWNDRYEVVHVPNQVIDVLELNSHLLPQQGKSLDLACGLGGNALRMAELGFDSHAWDLSDSAINKVHEFAKERHLEVSARQCDISLDELQIEMHKEDFDIIIVGHFLLRDIIPSLISALKPGGLIYYQTFVEQEYLYGNKLVADSGPRDTNFRLKKNELLSLFSELTVRYYREEGALVELTEDVPGEALLVAQKEMLSV